MTQEDKLKKIIDKAVERMSWEEKQTINDSPVDVSKLHYSILFDHSFAKAIWGEEEHQIDCIKCNAYEPNLDYCWEYHLQQAVISDNPIDYYYENLP